MFIRMSAMNNNSYYPEPFDQADYQPVPVSPSIPPRQEQQQQHSHIKGSALKRSGGKSAFKKRQPRLSANDNNDSMGHSQSSGSADYIDVFEDGPNQPPAYGTTDDDMSGPGVYMRSRHAQSAPQRGRRCEEESEDYSYAYSSQISRESVDRLMGLPKQRSVSLKDDYSVPPDRLSVSSGGPHLTSPDYIEPYKSHAEATRDINCNKQLDNSADGVYELAKDIDAIHVTGSPTHYPSAQLTGNRNTQYSHLNQFKFPKNTEIPEQPYDHINALQSNIEPSGSSSETSHQKQVEKKYSQEASVAPSMMQQPGEYQEPWDSEEGRRKLSVIMEKAERKDGQRKSISTPAGPRPSISPKLDRPSVVETKVAPPVATMRTLGRPQHDSEDSNTYESAWDSTNQRRKFSGIMQTAQKKSSTCTPPVISPRQSLPYSPAPDSHPQPPIPADYEVAWDLPEKQKEFEEKLAFARKHRESQGMVGHGHAGTANSILPEQVQERVRAPAEPPPRTPSPTLSPGFIRGRNRQDDTASDNMVRSDSCRSLGALAEKVDATIPLQDQNFYHGGIKRSVAERMLVVFKDGSYLVRKSESTKKDYSLTLKGWNGLAMHLKIGCQPDGKYVLGENSPPFPSVPEMIQYYTTHELPVHNAARICLLYPIPC